MIAICPNPFRDSGLLLTKRIISILSDNGYTSTVCPIFSENADDVLPNDLEYSSLASVSSDISLAIVLGGDGTILSVVRSLSGKTIPVFGVNMGTKGFMTAIEPEDIDIVASVAKGEFRQSKRMMLDVSVSRSGRVLLTDTALNDAVIHGYGDCIGITALCDGNRMTEISGDGVVLSTPSGSTGYSMSAGGPIVEPEANAIVFSPICAHSIGARPFVLDSSREITVIAGRLHSRRAYLAIDGQPVFDIENGDRITVKRSEEFTVMAEIGNKSFFEKTYEKLL